MEEQKSPGQLEQAAAEQAAIRPGQPAAPPVPASALEQAAAEEAQPNLIKDFWYFLLYNKKWWLLPILIILLLVSLLMLLSTTSVAPFIYTLF